MTQPALTLYGVLTKTNSDFNQLDGLSPNYTNNTPETNSKDSVDFRVPQNENWYQFLYKEQQFNQIQALKEKTLSYVSEDIELENQDSEEKKS